MGTTDEIIEILSQEELKKRVCYLCNKPIITRENCQVLYRTNHATNWKEFEKGKSRGWISIEIELEHEECPEIRKEYENECLTG